MIKILIKNLDQIIKKIHISGHANYADKGEDLVCSAITGIATGALNALDQKFPKSLNLEVKENEIIIKNLDLKNKDIQIMLEMLKIQLLTIWVQYKQYIEIKEVN